MPSLPSNPALSRGGRGAEKPRYLGVQFGDGYELRAAEGINNIGRTEQLRWRSITYPERDTLRDFFRGLKGVMPFTWQPPHEGAALNWRCSAWRSEDVSAALCHFTADIELYHGP